MTREQSSLPENWATVIVSDIGEVVTGNTLPKADGRNYGHHMPFVKPPELLHGTISQAGDGISEIGAQKSRVLPPYSILVSCIGNLGRTGINSVPVAFNQQINAIIPCKGIEPKFVFYQAQSPYFQRQLQELSSATTISIVNKGKFQKIKFKLAPAREQMRIVGKLEELFSELEKGVEALQTARQQLTVCRQAILAHAYTGTLSADWRARNQGKSVEELLINLPSEEVKTHEPLTPGESTEPLELPKGWRFAELGEFIDGIEAGKSFRCDEREPRDGEVGVAKVSAVTWGEYDERESKTCLDSSRVNSDYFIEKGDFLFSRANTIELVGACVIAKDVSRPVMLSDKTLRIKFSGISPRYFLHYLRSKKGRNEIMLGSTGNQDSMRNIGQDRIKSIVVPVCPPDEAEYIADRIEEVFSRIARIEGDISDQLAGASILRQGILAHAFSGRLVPQVASEEPASALLERIRAAHKTSLKGKRSNRKRAAA